MKPRVAGILLTFFIISCNFLPKELKSNQCYPNLKDSVELKELGVCLKFDANGLFDTTFIFQPYVGFCAFGADLSKNFFQPRFSNKKYNNDDSTGFQIEPINDSLLFLNFFWQTVDSTENISQEIARSKLENENISRIATKKMTYSNSFLHTINLSGLSIGIFGAESVNKNKRYHFSKLEVITIVGTIKITAYFQYSGYGSHSYLKEFTEIAKTIRIKKIVN